MARYGCTSPSHVREYGKRQYEAPYMRDIRYSLWHTFNTLPGYDPYDNDRMTFWDYASEGTKKRSLDDNDAAQESINQCHTRTHAY